MNEQTSVALQSLVIPLQRALSTLYARECDHFGYDAANASCIVDATLPYGMRVEAGSSPVIRASLAWTAEHVARQSTEHIVTILRKAVRLAHTRLRWTLDNSVPRCAAELGSDGKFRITGPSDFALPPRHFIVRYAITVTCPVTGVSQTRLNIPAGQLADNERDLYANVTTLAFAHEQAADLLPELPKSTEPTSVDITDTVTHHIVEGYTYAD
jgi:hypothetical protein